MAEGTVSFAGEPIIEVRAPLIEAQLIETLGHQQIQWPRLSRARRRAA